MNNGGLKCSVCSRALQVISGSIHHDDMLLQGYCNECDALHEILIKEFNTTEK